MMMKTTYNATGQPTRHEGKSDKEEEACAPDGARVTKALVAAHAVLVDQVNDEDAEERAQARDPICEGDVYG
jgi:protein-arginine kinase activator protein McsA